MLTGQSPRGLRTMTIPMLTPDWTVTLTETGWTYVELLRAWTCVLHDKTQIDEAAHTSVHSARQTLSSLFLQHLPHLSYNPEQSVKSRLCLITPELILVVRVPHYCLTSQESRNGGSFVHKACPGLHNDPSPPVPESPPFQAKLCPRFIWAPVTAVPLSHLSGKGQPSRPSIMRRPQAIPLSTQLPSAVPSEKPRT